MHWEAQAAITVWARRLSPRGENFGPSRLISPALVFVPSVPQTQLQLPALSGGKCPSKVASGETQPSPSEDTNLRRRVCSVNRERRPFSKGDLSNCWSLQGHVGLFTERNQFLERSEREEPDSWSSTLRDPSSSTGG